MVWFPGVSGCGYIFSQKPARKGRILRRSSLAHFRNTKKDERKKVPVRKRTQAIGICQNGA